MKTLMTTLSITLGLSVLGSGLVSTVQAQQIVPSVNRSAEPTLSGESLRMVESRTLDSDYQRFISQSRTPFQNGTIEDLSNQFRLKLTNEVDVITSPSDAQRQADPAQANQNPNANDASVQLQLGL